MKLWEKPDPDDGNRKGSGTEDGGKPRKRRAEGGPNALKDAEAVRKAVCDFTAGEDHLLDRKLVKYDCIASIAHARTLGKAGALTKGDVENLILELKAIIALDAAGKFKIEPADEDCHTAIENHLSRNLGDAGKRIHTGRSRNDQVAAALRLYYKDELACVSKMALELSSTIKSFDREHGSVQMPGYTHTRKAMPSTVGIWAGSFLDALADSLQILGLASELVDRCPLGSAAGYGSPVELDREHTSKLLGFGSVQRNPLYVQNGRGKLEAFMLHALSQIMLDLNKMATDIILFTASEFGFFTLPDELCTGSSIMPQKKNPDVLELVRAKYHVVTSLEARVLGISGNLISGYNRDLQLTKGPVMEAFSTAMGCLSIMSLVMRMLGVDRARCHCAMTDELYAAERAHELVKKGVPFRDAYRNVKSNYK